MNKFLTYVRIISLIHLFPFLFCSIYIHLISSPSLSFIVFSIIWVLLQTLLHHFLPIFHLYQTSFIIHWLWSLLLIFFYFLFTNIIWSLFSISLSINFVFFSACYKHWECPFFLSRVKMFLIDLINYFFWYFFFALLSYFLLVSLFNRMINKLFR